MKRNNVISAIWGNRMISMRIKLTAVAAVFALSMPSDARSQYCPDMLTIRDLKALAAVHSLVEPRPVALHPAIASLASSTLKNYACQSIVNWYAKKIGLTDDYVKAEVEGTGTPIATLRFSSSRHKDICGSIQYEMPRGLVPKASNDQANAFAEKSFNTVYLSFVDDIFNEFTPTAAGLGAISRNLSQRFLPDGRDLPKPSAQSAIEAASAFQTELMEKFRKLVAYQKWPAAEVEHFSDSAKCSRLLPIVSGPNSSALAQYGVAVDNFAEFSSWLDAAFK